VRAVRAALAIREELARELGMRSLADKVASLG
jgi:hypothetical protein